ncbi:PTS lactose/cellobiose transporter subunit IIA, partial [Escherichia coli]
TVHAQDHLMNAMVIQDLADDMIELYRRQSQTEGRP